MQRAWKITAISAVLLVALPAAAFFALVSRPRHYVPNDSPEAAVCNFCTALFFKDKAGLLGCSASEVGLDFLLENRKHAFCRRVDHVKRAQYSLTKPGDQFVMDGRNLTVPQQYSGESRAFVLVDFGHGQDPLPFVAVRLDGEWRVDQKPLVSAAKAALAADAKTK